MEDTAQDLILEAYCGSDVRGLEILPTDGYGAAGLRSGAYTIRVNRSDDGSLTWCTYADDESQQETIVAEEGGAPRHDLDTVRDAITRMIGWGDPDSITYDARDGVEWVE